VPPTHRRGGCWSLHVQCFRSYEAPPGAPGRPRKARLTAETLLSNIAYNTNYNNILFSRDN
jgi:hypothetical protein